MRCLRQDIVHPPCSRKASIGPAPPLTVGASRPSDPCHHTLRRARRPGPSGCTIYAQTARPASRSWRSRSLQARLLPLPARTAVSGNFFGDRVPRVRTPPSGESAWDGAGPPAEKTSAAPQSFGRTTLPPHAFAGRRRHLTVPPRTGALESGRNRLTRQRPGTPSAGLIPPRAWQERREPPARTDPQCLGRTCAFRRLDRQAGQKPCRHVCPSAGRAAAPESVQGPGSRRARNRFRRAGKSPAAGLKGLRAARVQVTARLREEERKRADAFPPMTRHISARAGRPGDVLRLPATGGRVPPPRGILSRDRHTGSDRERAGNCAGPHAGFPARAEEALGRAPCALGPVRENRR